MVAALLLVAAASLSPVAVAQEPEGEPDAQRTAAARALFEEGVAYSDADRWEEAADRFRRSLSLRDSSVVAYNLASALVHLGGLVEASELLQAVVRDEAAPEPARQAARRLLEEIEPRIGRLRVRLDGFPMQAEVQLDDRTLPQEAIGVPIPADPGTRTVRVVRARETVAEGAVEIPEGGEAEITLDVPPPPLVGPEVDEGYRPGAVLRGESVGPGFRPGQVLRTEEIPEGEPAEGDRAAEGEEARARGAGDPETTRVPGPEEAARAATPPPERRPPPEEDDGDVLSSPWFWGGVGAGVLVAGAVVAIIAIATGGSEATNVEGSLDPPVIPLGR